MAHRAFGLHAHITWHTRLRQATLRAADADIVDACIRSAAKHWRVRVHAQAVLSNHVHVVVAFRPDMPLTPFMRHAKSESARRVNEARGDVLHWARGYFVETLSRNHVRPACAYVAAQHRKHPTLIPQ
jgi:REP element-mobilizing transposase RayT